MQANRKIAEQFVLEMSGLDVTVANGYACRSRTDSIEFTIESYLYRPEVVAQKITRNLGVTPDTNLHNGIEWSWDLPQGRRMYLCAKDWGETQVGLVDFRATQTN